MKVIHELIQGSDAWLQFRAQHFGASEAAAMLGLSKTTTRSQLLRIKHTGLGKEFSDWVQANILDHGHEVEAMARPHVEALLGQDLYPVTCSDGEISASCDGLTMDDQIAFEHKQWNEGLAALVAAGIVPDEHMPQCQQIMLVTGAQKVVFVVSDGTPEQMVHAEVLADPKWFARIKAGWAQFAADLATYVPAEVAPTVTAAPIEALPAVSVQMQGSLTVHSNLDVFGKLLRDFIGKIPAKPSSEQEFADCDAACKALKRAEEALDGAEANALGQVQSVEQITRTIADLRTVARTARLASEKMVKARKEQIRTEEVQRGKDALNAFIVALNTTIGKPYMPTIQADFAGAISGKKTVDSVRNAIDTELARAKIVGNEVCGVIVQNMRTLRELAADYIFLFADTAAIVLKPCDDCRALVENRIAAHKAAEEKKEADTRERIRKEEAEKLPREQEARNREDERKAAEALAAAKPALPPAAAPIAAPVSAPQAPAANSPTVVPIRAAVDGRPPIKLGDIAERLGFQVTAAFLAQLGFEPIARERTSVLYRAADFSLIVEALVAHLRTVQAKQQQAA